VKIDCQEHAPPSLPGLGAAGLCSGAHRCAQSLQRPGPAEDGGGGIVSAIVSHSLTPIATGPQTSAPGANPYGLVSGRGEGRTSTRVFFMRAGILEQTACRCQFKCIKCIKAANLLAHREGRQLGQGWTEASGRSW
jgi:hypothetical protein